MILFADCGGAYRSQDGRFVIYPLEGGGWIAWHYHGRQAQRCMGRFADIGAAARECRP